MFVWGTFAITAAALALETALTRVFALSQGYHFAFLAISVALLGSGAGGTLLASWPRAREELVASRLLALSAVGFGLTTVVSYLVLNTFAFDMYRIAWQRLQILYLVIDYVSLTIPFFCSGLAVGVALEHSTRRHVTYAANLVGSAAGALLALGALALVGGAGTVALCAGLGFVAALLYVAGGRDWQRSLKTTGVIVCVVGVSAGVVLACRQPAWFEVQLSPYRPLSYTLQFPGARVLSSRWNAFSRVDVVESDAIHVSPGLSLSYAGVLPVQHGLYVDAHAQSAIVVGPQGATESWSSALLSRLPYQMRPGARVLVLDPGGGIEIAVGQGTGPARITAVWPNPLVVDAVRTYGGELYRDPRLQTVAQAPRSFARSHHASEDGGFDVVDLALNEAQRTVVSGAYALGEDYGYTLEAFEEYLALLNPGGLLVVHRWLQTPPSESVRAWALAVEALERRGVSSPGEQLIAIRSWSTMLILVKNGVLEPAEYDAVRAFADEARFDLVHLTGLQPDEANRYNVYEGAPYYHAFARVLSSSERSSLYAGYAYDVRPPTDNKPYFQHFFRWAQVPAVLQALGHTWQPFGGGGYLALWALLVLVTMVSLALMVLPLMLRRAGPTNHAERPSALMLAYAGCLGIAYLAVEIPLIQRCVLLLDHPTVAFALVVSVVLLSSGLGSLLAPRIRAGLCFLSLVVYLSALVAVWSPVSNWVLGHGMPVRVALVSAMLAPLGVLMGMPFPIGLAILSRRASYLVPWAWGINGATSVVASILAALVALDQGFAAVLASGAFLYLVAWALITLARRQKA
ncbi:MAG TPA: hypothetical protein VM366_08985 [Anaerolineae bacterium]|nr:hypothetical protein [Anaerolineae bacterium]